MHQLVVENTFSPLNALPTHLTFQQHAIPWVSAPAGCAPPPGTRAVVTNGRVEHVVLDGAWRDARATLLLPREGLPEGVVAALRECAATCLSLPVYTHIDGHAWVSPDMFISAETPAGFELSRKWWQP